MDIKSTFSLLPLIIQLTFYSYNLNAQSNSAFATETDSKINKPVVRTIAITGGAMYATSIYGLYHLWYRDYPQSSFHFFNDNAEWMQIDKAGHATTSYQVGRIGYYTLSQTGINNKKAIWIGGSVGLIYLTTVEIFDGFSAEWGASSGDVIANVVGASAFITQQLLWDEQRIALKWSYHHTKYAKYRPDLLGDNGLTRSLKDYNGHTYWLSANINSFLTKESRFPDWLNIALGYSGEGMTGAFSNPANHNGVALPTFDRHRRYFISPDIDFSRIKLKNKTFTIILNTLSFIKIPLPAVEINKKGATFHPFYY